MRSNGETLGTARLGRASAFQLTAFGQRWPLLDKVSTEAIFGRSWRELVNSLRARPRLSSAVGPIVGVARESLPGYFRSAPLDRRAPFMTTYRARREFCGSCSLRATSNQCG